MKKRNKKLLLVSLILLCAALFSATVFAAETEAPVGASPDYEESLANERDILFPPENTESGEENNEKTAATEGAEEKSERKGFFGFLLKFRKSGDFLASLAGGELPVVYSALFLIASLIICFFAYKFIKYCVGLSCFGIGIFITVFVCDKMALIDSGKNKLMCILCALLVGIILSAIAFCLPKVGIFFFVGASAYVILSGIKIPFLIAIVIAVAVAIVAALLIRVAVIVVSSGVGGLLSGALICSFLESAPPEYLHIPLGLVIFVLGMAFQFSGKKKGKHRKENREDERYEDSESEQSED